jgi:hypothetical protein
MDKPEEVKRFDLGQQVSIGTDKDFCKTVMIGVIEGKYVLFEDHAKALATANAKIVELEEKVKEADEFIDPEHHADVIQVMRDEINAVKSEKELIQKLGDGFSSALTLAEAELYTANKRAEKLVEALEEISKKNTSEEIRDRLNKCRLIAEQAIKEFRGGE